MPGLHLRGRVAGSGATLQIETSSGPRVISLGPDGRFETVLDVFGSGAAERLSHKYGFPVLGRVPLDPAVRVGGDAGDPISISAPDSAIAATFREIAGRFAQRVAIREHKALPILQ